MILVWDELGVDDFSDLEYVRVFPLLRAHTVIYLPDSLVEDVE